MDYKTPLIQAEQIEEAILLIQRNADRFPADFMFQLTDDECADLVFQFGRPRQHGGNRFNPCVFTQEGVAMLSSVLRSQRAVQVNIAIMRVFVRLRETLALHKDLAHKLTELEQKIEGHDHNISTLFEAIRKLMTPPETPRRKIGFQEGSVPYRVKRK